MSEQAEVASKEAVWGRATVPSLAVLVFAGGHGVRIGGAKPERVLAGHRLVDRAVQIARRNGSPVAVGLRALGQVDVDDVHIVLDRSGVEGPVAGLAAGLDWAKQRGADFLLTLPCDAPFLPHDFAVRLLRRLPANRVAAALPATHGQTHPACGLWRTDSIGILPTYLSSGRRSLIGFAEHIGYAVEDWGAPARDPFFNVNTTEELLTAEAWLAQPHLE